MTDEIDNVVYADFTPRPQPVAGPAKTMVYTVILTHHPDNRLDVIVNGTDTPAQRLMVCSALLAAAKMITQSLHKEDPVS